MDLPLRHSSENYQIHRTPFFRRVHHNDADENERLRQAYENVRKFDEKPIQEQIKKFRLGKLLRRIRESLTSSRSNRSNKHQSSPKTAQTTRAEELAKARQLGNNYCRQDIHIPTPLLSLLESRKYNHLQEWRREKYRRERRLQYGNCKSQMNRKSESNRVRIQCSHAMNMQRFAESDALCFHDCLVQETLSMTRERLRKLQKCQPKKDFIKFLAHCLATDKPNPEIMSTFEEILRSKNDMYWDLFEAINQRQQYIERYRRFMDKLSNLAISRAPENITTTSQVVIDSSVESFESTTNIKPCCKSPEIYIRTYRYSDEDEFLPPPSESLLRIPEHIDAEETHESVPAPPLLSKSSSSHLSANLRTDPAINIISLQPKFGDIIRDMVRKESAILLADLSKAIKH